MLGLGAIFVIITLLGVGYAFKRWALPLVGTFIGFGIGILLLAYQDLSVNWALGWVLIVLGLVTLVEAIALNIRVTEEYNREVDKYYEEHPVLTEEERFEREQREIRTSMLPQSLLKRYVNYRKMLKRPDSDYGEKE